MSRFKFPHVEELSLRVKALRYFMTVFCFLFFVLGAGVVAFAALLTGQRLGECGFIGRFYSGVYLLLAAGCATCFFSLVTCLHARRSKTSSHFLSMCFVVVIILVLQILAAIAGHIFYTAAAGGELVANMEPVWRRYGDQSSDRECVDAMQRRYRCCGVRAHTEWPALNPGGGSLSSTPSAGDDLLSAYPRSCWCSPEEEEGSSVCVDVNDPSSSRNANVTTTIAAATVTPASTVYTEGCLNAVLRDLYDSSLVPRIAGPLVALAEFVLLLAVMYFLHHIDNHSLVRAYVVDRGALAGSGDRSDLTGTATGCDSLPKDGIFSIDGGRASGVTSSSTGDVEPGEIISAGECEPGEIISSRGCGPKEITSTRENGPEEITFIKEIRTREIASTKENGTGKLTSSSAISRKSGPTESESREITSTQESEPRESESREITSTQESEPGKITSARECGSREVYVSRESGLTEHVSATASGPWEITSMRDSRTRIIADTKENGTRETASEPI